MLPPGEPQSKPGAHAAQDEARVPHPDAITIGIAGTSADHRLKHFAVSIVHHTQNWRPTLQTRSSGGNPSRETDLGARMVLWSPHGGALC